MNDEEGRIASELVRRILAGDRQAEAELAERYMSGLVLMLRFRCGELPLAEDLAQDTYLAVLERLRKRALNEPRKLSGFIHSTGINKYIGIMRRRVRRRTDSASDILDLIAGSAGDPAGELAREQLAQFVRCMLKKLRVPRDRDVLRRRYLLGQDKPQICAALEIESTHFDRVISRARKRFRDLLQNDDDDSPGPHLRIVR